MQIVRSSLRLLVCLATAAFLPYHASAQEDLSAKGKALYDQIRAAAPTGAAVTVQALAVKRDRVTMTFSGTFHFTGSVDGRVTGAVFSGKGNFSVELPPSDFERDHVKRLLGTEVVASDFDTAVLRFTDNTFEEIGKGGTQTAATPQVNKLATELDERILKETGANLSARLALSILNQEQPGFFFASFDGGARRRFSYVLDHQTRVPVNNFNLNGGEKGLIFKYRADDYDNDVWMAFYGEDDYQRGIVTYSDANDLIDVQHYDLDLNLREHKKAVRLNAAVRAQPRFPNVLAIPFRIGEDLGEFESHRLKKQLRLKQARLNDKDLAFAQEDWEGGFTLFLPAAAPAGAIDLELMLEGDFLRDSSIQDSHYPRSNTSWFPTHGYLDRATFDLTFTHPKRLKVASVGVRSSEVADVEDKEMVITKYRMDQPVPLVTFALARFERHSEMVKWENGDAPTPLEFNSLPGSLRAIKEDFIMAEISNSVRYFTLMFGKYPYPVFGAAFHPYGFGQGFPTLLMIPDTDRASKYTFAFLAHETAHQWWGNIVAWRSYRDQWLSEGFAEYSGVLYTRVREGTGARDDLLGQMRRSLKEPPMTEIGMGKGRLVDVGPIILGHRLSTRKTRGAYQALIYQKGALVLRMLHFLLSDPTTGEDKAFFDMMTDFVSRYRERAASTDDFRRVAGEHYAKSPIGRMYRQNNLDWFFSQWVRTAHMPSYQMEYRLEDQPDGKILLSGTVTQQHVPADWFMVLPVMISFGGNQQAQGTVHAYGPTSSFQIKLPARPRKVELDPNHWIISQDTSAKSK